MTKLKIGKQFDYQGGWTTELTEVVVADSRVYNSSYLEELTGGRTTTIFADLLRGMPGPSAEDYKQYYLGRPF